MKICTCFHFTCKFYVKLIFRFENLDVERTVWSEVLCSPSPQNSLVILQQEENRFSLPTQHFSRIVQSLNFLSINSGSFKLSINPTFYISRLVTLLTAAVRSTSFLLLRMKHASASSILNESESTRQGIS